MDCVRCERDMVKGAAFAGRQKYGTPQTLALSGVFEMGGVELFGKYGEIAGHNR